MARSLKKGAFCDDIWVFDDFHRRADHDDAFTWSWDATFD